MPLPLALAAANAVSDGKAVVAFAKSVPWKLIGLGLLVAAVLVQTLRLEMSARRADRIQFELNECQEGRKEDRRAYEQAQRDAEAKNKAEVQRIEREQQEITDEVSRNLNTRLERLRRELHQKTAAPGGASGRPGAGPNGKPTGRTDEEAGLCLAPEELLRAAESEERHDQLITWIEELLKVRR